MRLLPAVFLVTAALALSDASAGPLRRGLEASTTNSTAVDEEKICYFLFYPFQC